MDLVEDLPRPQHQSSQSVAQAAALMSQLSDVVARRRDRTQQGGGQAPSGVDALSDPSQTVAPTSTSAPGTAQSSAHQQLSEEAVKDAATHGETPATDASQASAADTVSADLGAADLQTALAADVIADARQAVSLASAAFPSSAGKTAAPAPAPTRPATPVTQTQPTRGR